METLRLVSVSFHTAGKVFDFDARSFELKRGNQVIVETERGRALGIVVKEPRETTPNLAPPNLKGVLRIANEADMEMSASNAQREAEALKFCQLRVQERKMEMKLVRAEYLFDGSKIVFYFTADGRIDFRDLVRDLAQHFRTRIEMRQIGVRDEAKLVGGLGVCGRELCCSSHLRTFAPVSVKMAKAQGLALNPTKISGQCGRLLCCLAYEYETYSELRKNLPKCGKKIQLESGTAEVIALDVLAQKMTVCCSNGDRIQIHIDDLKKGFDKPATEQPKSPERKVTKPSSPAEKKPAVDESAKKEEQRGKRRSTNRNRRPKAAQQKPDQQRSGQQAKSNEKPQEKGLDKQVKPTDQVQANKPEQEANPNRRRRRRPRRRTNQGKPPESNS